MNSENIDKEDVKRWFQLLVGKGEEAMKADIQETFSQPQPQLSETEIEKLAEKEYPYIKGRRIEDNTVILLRRQDFIKGLKYKLTATPQQADEVQ